MPHSATESDPAVDTLRAIGARITTPRLLVLRVLREAPAPLTHRELIDRTTALSPGAIDRVTLYRVLDWLVSNGLAVKAADAQRVFRFAAQAPSAQHERHVHFRCTTCGGVFCLKDAPPRAPRLPRGFRLTGISMDIRGECARCASGATA